VYIVSLVNFIFKCLNRVPFLSSTLSTQTFVLAARWRLVSDVCFRFSLRKLCSTAQYKFIPFSFCLTRPRTATNQKCAPAELFHRAKIFCLALIGPHDFRAFGCLPDRNGQQFLTATDSIQGHKSFKQRVWVRLVLVWTAAMEQSANKSQRAIKNQTHSKL